PTHNEVQRLYDHAFTTMTSQLFPPTSGLFNAGCVGHVYLSVRRGEQETIAGLANLCQLFHVPHVIALNVNLSFRSKQVERCELQIADGLNQPAVAPIRIDIKLRGFEPLLIFLDEREGIAILRCKMRSE